MPHRNAAAFRHIGQTARVSAGFPPYDDHSLSLLRNHQRFLLPLPRRVADSFKHGEGVPFRKQFFDGFKFLAFLRGLGRQHYGVGIFERLFFFQFL